MGQDSEAATTASGPRFARPWASQFLRALRKHRSVSRACEAVGKGRRTVYDFRDECPIFREAWDEALQINPDDLEASAFDRASNGWLEPVFHQGIAKGIRRRYSDRLTIFMLRCHRPEVYNVAVGDLAPPTPELVRGARDERARRVLDAHEHRDAHYARFAAVGNAVGSHGEE